MKRKALIRLGLVGVAATVLPIVGAGKAFADYAPQPGDIVGIGGDTPQYAVDFALNGDANGNSGFDATATVNRVVSFYATPDANGRSGYVQGSSESAPLPLNPTDVLRSGTNPVQRVQSSGAAITALLADTGATQKINFVSSASEPTAAQQTQAGTNGWGFLHVVQVATDSVKIAAATTTNAPTGLSAAELVSIYSGAITKWNQLPGNSGGSADTIVPLIPPSGSSIQKTFVADLKTANGGTAVTLSSAVKTVEQNDPTAITGNAAAADAIVPFSAGRLALWNTGYFHNPATVFPGGAALTPGVSLLSATAGDSGAAYNSPITDYVIFRQSDATGTPLEPGGTKNWVQTLFSAPGGSAPYFDRAAGQALLASAGVTPSYNDLGNVSNG
jgi:ABC-type phosphate transport system substrate-binding protein